MNGTRDTFSGLLQLAVLNRTGVVVSADGDREKLLQTVLVDQLLNCHPGLERIATLTNETGVTDVVLALVQETELIEVNESC